MNAGNYTAKIQDWGIKHFADKDEYKLFVRFEIQNPEDPKERYISWNGLLDDSPRTSKAGKEYTMLNITRMNLKNLGYKYGEDLEAIITKPDAFDTSETFILDVASFQGKDGRAGTYVRSFESTTRPKEENSNSNVKQLEKTEAASFLSGLMNRNGLKKAVNDNIGDIAF